MNSGLRRALLASAAAFVSTAVFSTSVQAAAPLAVEVVVVTAQKREQRVQDVPIAISAFTGETLKNLGVDNPLDLAAYTPNFQIGGLGGSNNSVNPWLNIRGIQLIDTSFVNDQSVAMYVDEVYQGAIGAGVQSLFDVERVEVLKGPQGSLFGRNTSAGLVHVITAQPTDTFQAYANAGFGEYNKRMVQGAISGPLSDQVRARLAFTYSGNDGYRSNPNTGTDSFGAMDSFALRGTMDFDAAENLRLKASFHYAHGEGIFPGRDFRGTRVPGNTGVNCTSPQDVFNGVCSTRKNFINTSNDPNVVYSYRDSPTSYESAGGLLRGEYDLENVNIVSITAYESWKSYQLQDTGMGPLSFNNVTSDFNAYSYNFSQELRASGQRGETNWVTGFFYYTDTHHVTANYEDWWARISGGTVTYPTSGREGKVNAASFAAYGQIETPIVDDVTLAIGGRYTKEARDLATMKVWTNCWVFQCNPSTNTSAKKSFANFSGDVTLRYKPSDHLMVYARYARGFKSGGWNALATAFNQAGPAGPEVVDDWEVGLKGDWLGGRVQADGAAFYYLFDGLQSSLNQIVNGVAQSNFINAGTATIYGAELQMTVRPIEQLELQGTLGLLSTRIDSVATGGLGVLPGNLLPNAPETNASFLTRYTFDLGDSGSLSLQGEMRYQSHVFFTVDNDPFRSMDAYSLFNARVRWESTDGHYNAQFSVDNIANKRYATGAFQTTTFDVMYFEPGQPRWWMFKVGFKY